MLRDVLKDLNYFNGFITKREALANNSLNKLETGEISEDRLVAASNLISDYYISIIKAKYSRGDDMSSREVLNYYNIALKLIIDYWDSNGGFISGSNGKQVNGNYGVSKYLKYLDIFSLGVLLNSQLEPRQKLLDLIANDSANDSLFNFLIDRSIGSSTIVENSNPFYQSLKEIILIDDKIELASRVRYFLFEEWYDSLKETGYYNQHENRHNVYAGYWCFPAAAIVKKLSLDETSIADSIYYPKIIDFAI